MSASFDVQKIRQDFPILASEIYGKPLVYLDNASSAQKPLQVSEAMAEFTNHGYANVHRGLHYLSNSATTAFENARETVRQFLNAAQSSQIIFTGGATDAINLVAYSFVEPMIEAGDEIILSEMEHHSNIVPWHFMRERHGAVLKWVSVNDAGELDMESYEAAFSDKTKFVALTQMSNALGTINPTKQMVDIAHKNGVPILLDGCQGAVHLKNDMQSLNPDFYVFSGHKAYGPTGIGVLYGDAARLAEMRPFRGGGEMIREVSKDAVTYGDAPHRFEAGTPPIIEVIGLGAALNYMMDIGFEAIGPHENALRDHAMEAVGAINRVKIYGTAKEKGAIVAFGVEGIHPHDLASVIDRSGVAVRAGHHCAQPLMQRFNVPATARASFAVYNTHEEVDALAEALHKAIDFFG